MNILIFGAPNIGKTTTAMLLVKKLNYQFYDVSEYCIELYGSINNYLEKYLFAFRWEMKAVELTN